MTAGRLGFVGAFIASVLALTSPAEAAASTTVEFPSADSTVVASGGFAGGEVGLFWSARRGDRVTETFNGPPQVDRIVLALDVVTNALNSGAQVQWQVEINGVVVDAFTVPEGFVGPITRDVSFSPIAGPSYEVTLRVTNEVPMGAGSHSFAAAGERPHSLQLIQSISTPTTRAACKNGGWRNFANDQGQPFRDQGQCVSYVVAHRR